VTRIREAIEQVGKRYADQPETARAADRPAVAVVVGGLRCKAEGPNGAAIVTDMPKGIGGGGSAPTPGWYLRAALATCDATVIAMRAAQLGVVLTALEVAVESRSDTRGLLGVGDPVPPGPLEMGVHVRIAADGASPDQLRQIVHWAEAHSPVGDAVRRAVPSRVEVDIA
jgi:uncharacterized OsmC-like protein